MIPRKKSRRKERKCLIGFIGNRNRHGWHVMCRGFSQKGPGCMIRPRCPLSCPWPGPGLLPAQTQWERDSNLWTFIMQGETWCLIQEEHGLVQCSWTG
ncbi:hypothetical protein SKAU_G00240300 [Synaphobranchus kaupii]|uniref:Uncharacterized protein n=1 Tax=Synaphobranchus kaupii TaxID=118154 RepID=A0A9Q1IU62_SYNKA|nr:hypothetical protein SKAU_G00240300 [Synaphobranchus kaupii]